MNYVIIARLFQLRPYKDADSVTESRLVSYSALFTFLVRWHDGAINFSPGDVISVHSPASRMTSFFAYIISNCKDWIHDTQHNIKNSCPILNQLCDAECSYTGCFYDEYCYDECHYDECHYTKCHYYEFHYHECYYTECCYDKCRFDECC
jgi:hypothetical protein